MLKLPKVKKGNCFVVVFMNYLTKWPEAFATADQTALTTAKLFVKKIVSRHGAPGQLLSDCGPSFLSIVLMSVCAVMGIKKVNTTAYHPQTDGLVERFNCTLLKHAGKESDQDSGVG